jgi:hypothetical protein
MPDRTVGIHSGTVALRCLWTVPATIPPRSTAPSHAGTPVIQLRATSTGINGIRLRSSINGMCVTQSLRISAPGILRRMGP